MKSSLVNMVTVLLCITAVTSTAVGVVYKVTSGPIEQAKLQKKSAALSQVLPPFDNNPAEAVDTVSTVSGDAYVYSASAEGSVVGYAVESSANGFSGPVRIMTGFLPDGTIYNIQVLEQAETPGLGAKLVEENNPVKASLVGVKPVDISMAVRKDGGDVDAITASTISSRAYVNAVSSAYTAFLEVSGVEAAGWDSSTGATVSSHTSLDEDAVEAGGAAIVEPSGESADVATGATVADSTDWQQEDKVMH